jgi:rfaE bifunctional protein nucleotidyltransferase chain/domain
MSKIKAREELVPLITKLKSEGKTVGFTSGTFDILHAGHVAYLDEARKRCDALIVGINSDDSVRLYKDPSRPIVSQNDRAAVIAALESVSYVMIFNETNNQANITLLKPDLYIKAGDYAEEQTAKSKQLTSAPLVHAYGGRVEIIPFKEGHSSTSIINKIVASAPGYFSSPRPAPCRAVFLDRDGTIIEHVEYIHEPEKVVFIPGALEAIKTLKEAGFRVIMVTNQPGIGLGYFTVEDFFKVNKVVLKGIAQQGITIDKVYFCPHNEADKCRCRKPQTALLQRAEEELGVDLSQSYVVGDMTIDVQLGRNGGCKSIQVLTGMSGSDKRYAVTPDYTAPSLVEATSWILEQG